MKNDKEFLISPDLENDNLTKEIEGVNEAGECVKLPVVKEIPLTIYLNKQEIVTAMTLGDMPDLLAVGYLLNQNMLKSKTSQGGTASKHSFVHHSKSESESAGGDRRGEAGVHRCPWEGFTAEAGVFFVEWAAACAWLGIISGALRHGADGLPQ